jgi:wyosine [tRNA(Phe)-imidazoG37] synthetase (radical SAM superfamily)
MVIKMSEKSYIYGTVPSRRLGYSLGVDTIPFKTCTFDCIYCQLSKTTHKTVERKEYVPTRKILGQLKKILSAEKKIDYITFAGSGEPTLHSEIGKIIKAIKKMTSIHIAVITNGSLLFEKKLRNDLQNADLVVPSLDAVTDEIFKKINRPCPSLDIEKIITGLKDFRREFKGLIWLEIMLAKGINDDLKHLQKIKSIITEIKPDKIQLNTVVRPPNEKFARPLNLEDLERIRDFFGDRCEIISKFKREKRRIYSKDIERDIIELIRRRPVTLEDISKVLGIHQNEAIKYINFLQESNKINFYYHQGVKYYKIKLD